MLNENLKAIRKSKGLSQEEFAVKLNVVRQTVSKWERGLSVPDSDMLVSISEVLETPVSVLLGETVTETAPDALQTLAEKLEVINLQLARKQTAGRRCLRRCFFLLGLLTVLGLLFSFLWGSPYLAWDFKDPEYAVAGTILHGAEYIFVRLSPFLLIGSAAGVFLTRDRRS